jgi:hypothetical protein
VSKKDQLALKEPAFSEMPSQSKRVILFEEIRTSHRADFYIKAQYLNQKFIFHAI